jgi:ADP-heptose:LPS heptosyltransferase
MTILLLQLKRIGDLILTTPVVAALREEFPTAKIHLVIDAAGSSLAPLLGADTVWIHRKGGPNPWVWRDLPRLRPDWCFDLSGTDRSAWFTALARARQRVTYERFRRKAFRRLLFTDFVESSVRDRHTADHAVDLLAPLGIRRNHVPLSLHLPESAAQPARPCAVLHAGTARPEKYWQADRWAAVAAHLHHRHGLEIVLTGSTAPDETVHLEAIRQECGVPTVNLAGTTDLAGLAGVIAGARIFCGVDTAAMHLAEAARTPTVALFGPTNPFHWRPRHTAAVVLRADTTEPFKPGQTGGPMDHLTTAAVVAACDRLLAETGRKSH